MIKMLIYLFQGLHEDEETVKLDELAAQVRELGNKIEKTVPPKLRLANRLDDVREKYQSTKSEFEDVRKKAKSAKITFQQLKRQRRDMFMKCFEFVSQQERFKSLSDSKTGFVLDGRKYDIIEHTFYHLK